MNKAFVYPFLGALLGIVLYGCGAGASVNGQHTAGGPASAQPANTGEGFDLAQGDSFLGFFRRMFSADFMPHGHCYFWRPEIVWLHVLSDGLIALSYYAIPLVLVFFMRRRKDLPFLWMFGLFGAFILLCGTTHVMSIVTLWNPIYRLDGAVKAATAAVSLITGILLVPLIPQALALRSPKELEVANRKLEGEVSERTRAQAALAERAQELAEANEKLKEIERLKDNFFANVSHELRTPLTLILAPLESLLSNEYGQLTAAQAAALQAMHNNSLRLYQMVNSILDFAKIGAAKIEVKREPTNILTLTRSIFSEFQTVMKPKGIESHFEMKLASPVVGMDRYLYERIVFNLLSNAAKFTPNGGTVSVSLEHEANHLVLSVRDTGIGIPEAEQKQLFQKFRQVEGSSTRRFEGTGLGLALVKEFATLLGGRAGVESAVGKGSTFTVVLEAPPAKESPEATGHVPSPYQFQKYDTQISLPQTPVRATAHLNRERSSKILIAEDNAELASYVASLLGGLAETRVAHDGEQALEVIADWAPDLIVADVMMPKLDGISLCKQLKSNPKTSHMPFVLLTALTHREALIRGWESGADEYLFKPFHPRELWTRIKTMLSVAADRKLLAEKTTLLEAANKDLEEFSSTLSHDLRAPLRRIRSYCDLMEVSVAANTEEETRQRLERIKDNANKMNELIEDVLGMTRLNRAEMRPTVVDLSEMTEGILHELQQSLPDRTVKLEVAENVCVRGDSVLLRSLMENLLANAWKYTSGRTDAAIEFGVTAEKGESVYFVRDNGVGFDMAHSNKLFGLFQRLHDPSKYPGTGVGLASVKRIISRHGGRVWAESSPGEGATFYFTIAKPGP